MTSCTSSPQFDTEDRTKTIGFWDFASNHPVALFFFVMAIGWALQNVFTAIRSPRAILLQQDPREPGRFIELIPRKECLLREGENGFALSMGATSGAVSGTSK